MFTFPLYALIIFQLYPRVLNINNLFLYSLFVHHKLKKFLIINVRLKKMNDNNVAGLLKYLIQYINFILLFMTNADV